MSVNSPALNVCRLEFTILGNLLFARLSTDQILTGPKPPQLPKVLSFSTHLQLNPRLATDPED